MAFGRHSQLGGGGKERWEQEDLNIVAGRTNELGPDSDAKIPFFESFFKNFFAQRRFPNGGKVFKEVFKEANLLLTIDIFFEE